MNYLTKTCPHCGTQLQQKEGAFELVKRGMTMTIADSSPGLSVSLYTCPQCGHIELYDLRVTARI